MTGAAASWPGAAARPAPPLALILLFLTFAYACNVLSPQLAPSDFAELSAATNAAATSAANPLNQLVWLALGVLALAAAWRCPARIGLALRRNLPLAALLGLAVASVAWSAHPEIAARRAALQCVVAACVMVGVAAAPSARAVVATLGLVFALLLAMTLATLPFPFAFDATGYFRGAAGDKNTLGALAALALLINAACVALAATATGRVLALGQIAAWAGVLALSVSKTSIGLAVLVPCGVWAARAAGERLRLSIGAVLALGLGGVVLVAALLLAALPLGAGDIAALATGDATFTGRTEIWRFALAQLEGAWIVGHGYGSFWGVGQHAPNLASPVFFIRLLNQAHNGYLDLALALGLAGVALFAAQLVAFAMQVEQRQVSRGRRLFAWTLVAYGLAANMMESSILRVANPEFLMMMVGFALAMPRRAPA